MPVVAFMVQDDSTTPAYNQFLFHKRPWICEIQHQLHFREVWSADSDLKYWLSNLRKVSLGSAESQSDFLRFHPVLIQYIQEQAEQGLRINIIHDIMLLSIESIQRSELKSFQKNTEQRSAISMLSAQALHCARLCKAYGILPQDLALSPRSDRFV
jgi:hypothetical protein